jgi:hypothetical protein
MMGQSGRRNKTHRVLRSQGHHDSALNPKQKAVGTPIGLWADRRWGAFENWQQGRQ